MGLEAAGAATAENSCSSKRCPGCFRPSAALIAVLPFVNISGDKEQEYFSDGLTEELLNSLSRINELQVAARTSAFSFKGTNTDIGTIARKLNVASVLEGSVRKSSKKLRISAQLVNAGTGFHLWSRSYDRDLTDVLQLQTEIANAVANALKVTLLGDAAVKIETGGTRNPAAFDAYLRASKAYWAYQSEEDEQAAIAAYAEATRLDPDYALAYADRSLALANFAITWPTGSAVRAYQQRAEADARKAIALAPDLAQGHFALAYFSQISLEFAAAIKEYERALALGSGNARLLRYSGEFASQMGRKDAGLTAVRRAVVLDPLSPNAHVSVGLTLIGLRRYDEAVAAFTDAKSLAPNDIYVNGDLGVAYYLSGNFQSARSSCEAESYGELKHFCLAMTYDKLGRRADAEAALAEIRAKLGNRAAYRYVVIYAQWGEIPRALDWLDTAMRQRDSDLVRVKTDPFLDPLRKEPRFQAIERELKFPQ
jgi:TolB-like protein